MRVVLCGSGSFAIPTLRVLHAGKHELAEVITQPPRPAGRGARMRPSPVAEAAAELGLTAAAVEDVNADAAVAALRTIAPDVICVADFGQFVRKPFRDCARLDAINLHGSLLPLLRGAAPVNWAVIRGLRQTGVTTFSLVDRMDAGDLYAQKETFVSPDETAAELRARLAELGAQLVCETLDMLAAGTARRMPQDDSKATSAPRLTKAHGRVDFSASAEEVRNLIHGTWPWPGGQAVFVHGDKRIPVTLARAAVAGGEVDAEPGTLDDDLCTATGGGRVAIQQIKPAGKRLMDWQDFINGYRARPGDRFVQVPDD